MTMEGKDQVTLVGTFIENFSYSHELYGRTYFTARLEVSRGNGNYDTLPILRQFSTEDDYEVAGRHFRVDGQIRSFAPKDSPDRRRECFVIAYDITETDEPDKNLVTISGQVLKEPYFARGGEVALIPVKIPINERKYWRVQCALWRKNHLSEALNIKAGDWLNIVGRLQSYEKTRVIQDNYTETFMVYEISVDYVEGNYA